MFSRKAFAQERLGLGELKSSFPRRRSSSLNVLVAPGVAPALLGWEERAADLGLRPHARVCYDLSSHPARFIKRGGGKHHGDAEPTTEKKLLRGMRGFGSCLRCVQKEW